MTGPQPVILETVKALRADVASARAQGRRVGLVPSMGALHEGHLTLVRRALAETDHAIVSIFVNPTQFGPREDFAAYPRTWGADIAKLRDAGAHAVFHPAIAEMYPHGFTTTVSAGDIGHDLEGLIRPGHFDAVATVVAKLLLQALPDTAFFGEKDYQQLLVIRRMAADLDIPVRIVGVPTVRDGKGLALSSRNAYLKPDEYPAAVRLNLILRDIAGAVQSGTPWRQALAKGRADLDAVFNPVDYLEIRDDKTLQAPDNARKDGLRVLAAVRVGATRLIDNRPIVA